MAKNVIFYPKNVQKIEKIWNQSFFKLQTSMIAQNDHNEILINFLLLHFLPGELEKLENGKNVIFYPKNDQKIENFRNFFEKIFLVGIDSECFKTYFEMKISILKIFSSWKIFFWDIAVFWKIGDQKIEDFRKNFFVGIDLEWLKTCFKTKISFLKMFSR